MESYKKKFISCDTGTNYSLKCFSLSHLKLIVHFVLMLPSILAGATKAKEVICLTINSSRKTLYYKLTDCQIHLLQSSGMSNACKLHKQLHNFLPFQNVLKFLLSVLSIYVFIFIKNTSTHEGIIIKG